MIYGVDDWLQVGKFEARSQTAGMELIYVLYLVNPHWKRTHDPTMERPLAPRRVVLATSTDAVALEIKRRMIVLILKDVIAGSEVPA